MSGKVLGITTAVLVVLLGIVVLGIGCSAVNQEARLRNAITAKQKDNTSEFDNMWKKISQTVQVTDRSRDSLKEIFVEHAKARTGDGKGGELMKWVQESCPNVDNSTFTNLQNIIVGSRDSWTQRQKEILDLKREHENLRTTYPSSFFVGSKPEIQVQIVTSAKTDAAFSTGKDEDVELFKKK